MPPAHAALPLTTDLRQIVAMTRHVCLLGLVLVLFVPSLACKKTEAQTTPPGDEHAHQHHGEGHGGEGHHAGDFEGREVVDNWNARPGDVTVCPMSGKKFEVKEDSGRFDYQGHSFVFCCSNCLDEIAGDPGKYLDELVEQAGGSVDATSE